MGMPSFRRNYTTAVKNAVHRTDTIKAVRDTCERAAGFKATAEKMGVKVTGEYWTLGAFVSALQTIAALRDTVLFVKRRPGTGHAH
jgi:uncharacterized protein with GYD domain